MVVGALAANGVVEGEAAGERGHDAGAPGGAGASEEGDAVAAAPHLRAGSALGAAAAAAAVTVVSRRGRRGCLGGGEVVEAGAAEVEDDLAEEGLGDMVDLADGVHGGEEELEVGGVARGEDVVLRLGDVDRTGYVEGQGYEGAPLCWGGGGRSAYMCYVCIGDTVGESKKWQRGLGWDVG